jgi:hypothetical protein
VKESGTYSMSKRRELETAIAALEAQRATLGDAAIDAAQNGLKNELGKLRVEETSAEAESNKSTRRLITYRGDHRANSGMYEGEIGHAEVNKAIRESEKVILFGQQTRLRSRRLMDDDRLPRIQPGHRLSKFFYGAVRQLPERLLDALLAKKVSVSLIRGKDLLVFHSTREHQGIHTGRTRRTIYIPEPILEQAYDMGYDYWAIAEILIQESWPLLDYILLLEFVERCQMILRRRYTLGYSLVQDTLHGLNKHMRDMSQKYEDLSTRLRKGDEIAAFFTTYSPKLFDLRKDIVEKDPYDVTDGIYDNEWERSHGRSKLSEVAAINSFPTYFMIDRDIVHPAAFRRAEELSIEIEPKTPEEIIHDLWDEARFRTSLSSRTETLIDRLIATGASGIRAFLSATAFGFSLTGLFGRGKYQIDLNRHNVLDFFKERIQSYSGSGKSEAPGSICYDFRCLCNHFLVVRRGEYIRDLKRLPGEALKERESEIRGILLSIVAGAVHPNRARELRKLIITSKDLANLLNAVEQAVKVEKTEVEDRYLSAFLYKLDEHPLYQSHFLSESRELNGGVLPGSESIRPVIQKLLEFIPERSFRWTSDPSEHRWYLAQFQGEDRRDPYEPMLFSWLTAILIRLDRSEDYSQICEEIEMLGEYAVPPLQDIVKSRDHYGREGRMPILKATRSILENLASEDSALRREWNAAIERARINPFDEPSSLSRPRERITIDRTTP